MPVALQILLPALLGCFVLASLLSYLGLHVLEREIIFIDIALAQIAALGTAVAALHGIEPHTAASYIWSLLFTFAGAILFVGTRAYRKHVPQEALIGITYAVAAAVAVLVANSLPHGDEEIKEILIGSLLTLTLQQVGVTALVFLLLGLFHVIFRRHFLRITFEHKDHKELPRKDLWWDFAFYLSFGVVITASVHIAGVLLVFSFLIIPAVFAALFAKGLRNRLFIAWAFSALVAATGIYSSFKLDLPTGAAIVATFGSGLLAGALLRALVLSLNVRIRSGRPGLERQSRKR